MTQTASLLPALAAGVLLACTHVVAGKLRFLDGTPRSRWLSAAGGVSVAYVFVHLIPELAAGRHALEREETVFLVALAGLVVFYGLERAAKLSGGARRHAAHARSRKEEGDAAVFWLHAVPFGLYNLLIGYLLLHREQPGLRGLALFALAMLLHFTVNDYGLRADFAERYERHGRWVFVAALAAGFALGAATEVSERTLTLLLAFLAGGVVLNVLKEELPEERESRFSAFVLGAAGYAALLLAV